MSFKMRAKSLEPVIPSSDPKVERFAVCDIEVANWTNFLVIGSYEKINGFKTYDILTNYFDFIFSNRFAPNIIYAHFGGKFDFQFILRDFLTKSDYYIDDMIPRASGLLCFSASQLEEEYPEELKYLVKEKVIRKRDIIDEKPNKQGKLRYKARTIQFRDCSAFLPFSLRSLCESFKVDHPKLDIDYEKITKITPELIKYLEHDCRGLYEVIEKFFNWPLIKRAGSSFTIASQSLKVFQTFLKQEIPSLGAKTDAFIRAGYFGGRVEIFKPLFISPDGKKKIRCYDVNSLYPTVMKNNDYPTQVKCWTHIYDGSEMGFYDAVVEVPKDMYVPPLATVQNIDGTDKLIFPTGQFRVTASTIELEYAKSVGVKIISTGQGILFKNGGPIFKEYIEELYKIRQTSAKESVDNILAKLLMNSCYGRFALRRDRTNLEIYSGQEGADFHSEIESDKGTIRFVTTEKSLDFTFTNVAIAAWVTSLARIHMHKIYMKCKNDLYYTDTDSIFTTAVLPSDEHELGALKCEYEIDKACFILPKTYLVQSQDSIFKAYDAKGKPYKTNKKLVMKGFDKKKIQGFELQDFMSALEGDLRKLRAKATPKFATFKTALKKGYFVGLLEESERQLRSKYDKRKIIKLGNEKYDTVPLELSLKM